MFIICHIELEPSIHPTQMYPSMSRQLLRPTAVAVLTLRGAFVLYPHNNKQQQQFY